MKGSGPNPCPMQGQEVAESCVSFERLQELLLKSLWELVPESNHSSVEYFFLLSTWIFPHCNLILLSVVLLL